MTTYGEAEHNVTCKVTLTQPIYTKADVYIDIYANGHIYILYILIHTLIYVLCIYLYTYKFTFYFINILHLNNYLLIYVTLIHIHKIIICSFMPCINILALTYSSIYYVLYIFIHIHTKGCK